MSVAGEFSGAMRALGIAAIFTLLGPVIVAALTVLVVYVLGKPFRELILLSTDIEVIRPILSLATVLLVIIALGTAFVPCLVTGVSFALVAVYFEQNAWWVAAAIAVLVAFVIVALGYLDPPQADPNVMVVAPALRARQGAIFAGILAVPAVITASVCWFVTRRLQQVPA